MLRAIAQAGLIVSISSTAFAQTASLSSRTFEVASVKHNTTGGRMETAPRRSGDLVSMHNSQLYSIVCYAYHLHGSYQLVGYLGYGADDWNGFDIDARVGHDATEDQVRLMFQALLEDRFKLKLHRETRELPEYELVIAKGSASRLKTSGDGPMNLAIEGKRFTQPSGSCGISMWLEGSHLVCHAATIEQIVAALSNELHAPVTDKTGLMGTYDLNLRYMPEDRKAKVDADADVAVGPSLPQAFQEELGLKLEKGKGPVAVIVIDSFEKKPSEN